MKNIKLIPRFKDEDEEREFWATHDATDYFDMDHPLDISEFRVKPSTKPVTLRLPWSLLGDLKREADKRDVPYQSLMKIWLVEKLQEVQRVVKVSQVSDKGGGYKVKKSAR